MPFAIKAEISGLEPLIKALQSLEKKAAKKILKDAVNDASKIVLKAAKANVPVATTGIHHELLKKSLGRKVKVYRKTGKVIAIIGPRRGFKQTKSGKQLSALGKQFQDAGIDPAHYAHLIEFGRSAITHTEARALAIPVQGWDAVIFRPRAGPVAPHPFMRPALDSTQSAVKGAMEAAIKAGIEREAGKTDDGGSESEINSGD